jgi:hypothetical protein
VTIALSTSALCSRVEAALRGQHREAGAEFDALYGDEWIAVFSLAFTVVMLQFTEILARAGLRSPAVLRQDIQRRRPKPRTRPGNWGASRWIQSSR